MPRYVDLHAHYLPALDDGSTGIEMSLQMVRALAALGFSDLYATPHQRAGMFMPDAGAIASAFDRVSADVGAAAPGLKLGLGAENFWDDVFHARLAEQLGKSAALLIDLAALEGAHGRAEMKTARRLVLDGLAHAGASDVHRPEDQGAVAAGMAWIRKQLGPDALEEMLAENPRRLLTGEMPDPPRSA
jgi:tyrosine-protein phosphatase YwqE